MVQIHGIGLAIIMRQKNQFWNCFQLHSTPGVKWTHQALVSVVHWQASLSIVSACHSKILVFISSLANMCQMSLRLFTRMYVLRWNSNCQLLLNAVHGGGFSEVIHGSKRWWLHESALPFNPDETQLQWLQSHYTSNLLTDRTFENLSECTIVPGDILYFPSGWYHATLNLNSYTAFVSTFTQGEDEGSIGDDANHSFDLWEPRKKTTFNFLFYTEK